MFIANPDAKHLATPKQSGTNLASPIWHLSGIYTNLASAKIHILSGSDGSGKLTLEAILPHLPIYTPTPLPAYLHTHLPITHLSTYTLITPTTTHL